MIRSARRSVEAGPSRRIGVEITRRQLFGAGLGVVWTGCCRARPPPGRRRSRSADGSRTTREIRPNGSPPATPERVRQGSLLVAVVSRLSTATLAPTVGEVSDDQGNHWRQAVEYFADDHYGVDIWYCERARGGTGPRSRRSVWAIRSIRVPTA